jgi:hypothetical protein
MGAIHGRKVQGTRRPHDKHRWPKRFRNRPHATIPLAKEYLHDCRVRKGTAKLPDFEHSEP